MEFNGGQFHCFSHQEGGEFSPDGKTIKTLFSWEGRWEGDNRDNPLPKIPNIAKMLDKGCAQDGEDPSRLVAGGGKQERS